MSFFNKQREITSLLIFFFFTAGGLNAQELSFPRLDGFSLNDDFPVYTPDNLWDYINGGAESYNTLGFVDLHIAEYTKGKKNRITIEIYRHRNENLAFGIYSMERAASYSFFKLGAQAYREDGLVHFFKGSYYVKVRTSSKSKKTLEAVENLAVLAGQFIEGSNEFPSALKLLPSDGRKANEEMYLSENVIGHEFLRNAIRATYELEDSRFKIYLFTEGTIESIRAMLMTYLRRLDLDSDIEARGKVAFKDGYNGDIFLAWQDNMAVIITGLKADQSEIANRYINEILNIDE